MKKILHNAMYGIGLLTIATSTMAAPMTFDLSNGGSGALSGSGQSTIWSGSESGISLTATGYGDFDPTSASSIGDTVTYDTQRRITQFGNGIGVDGLNPDNDGVIDGRGGNNDAVNFIFSQDVDLISVTFSRWNSGDDFHLIVGDTLTLTDVNDDGGNPNPFTWNASDLYSATEFGIGADGSTDKFRIQSITVDVLTPDAVPTPGTLSLMILAFAGMGFVGYKRKSA